LRNILLNLMLFLMNILTMKR